MESFGRLHTAESVESNQMVGVVFSKIFSDGVPNIGIYMRFGTTTVYPYYVGTVFEMVGQVSCKYLGLLHRHVLVAQYQMRPCGHDGHIHTILSGKVDNVIGMIPVIILCRIVRVVAGRMYGLSQVAVGKAIIAISVFIGIELIKYTLYNIEALGFSVFQDRFSPVRD